MDLANCASDPLAFFKATTTIRKPPSGLLRKMASTAPVTSCSLIQPPKSTATLNVSRDLLFAPWYEAAGHSSVNIGSRVRLIR